MAECWDFNLFRQFFLQFTFSSGSILFYWGKKVVTVEYSFWVCFMKIKIDIWLWIRSYHLLAAITTSHSSFHCGVMPPALSPLLSIFHDCLCWCQYVRFRGADWQKIQAEKQFCETAKSRQKWAVMVDIHQGKYITGHATWCRIWTDGWVSEVRSSF